MAAPQPNSASTRDASVGGAIRLGAEMVIRLSSVIATLWLTRSLGVTTFGVFVLGLSVGLILAELCDLGLNAIVVPMIVRSHRNVRTLFLLKATMTVILLALCFLLIPAASALSGVMPALLWLTTIHFIGASWIEMSGTVLRGLGLRAQEAALLFVFRFVLVALVIGAPFGVTVSGASMAYAVAIGPALLVAAFLLQASSRGDGAAETPLSVILRQAAPMGLNSYLAIFSTRVEIFLLQAFQGEHAVGLFGGAVRIIESLLTLPSAIAAGALPSISRDVAQGTHGAAQRTFGVITWIAMPSAIGLALCAPGVLSVLGPGFVLGAPVLRILSVALVLCFANVALFHILIGASDTGMVPRLTGLRVTAALVLGAMTIPVLGLEGGAVSFVGSELLLFVLLVRRSRRFAAVQVGRPVFHALLACLPMVALILVVAPTLIVSILLGGMSFAVAAILIFRRGTFAAGLA